MKRLTSTLLALAICGFTVSGLPAADSDRQGTLYQRLGGMPAIQAVVDDFVGRILADDRVNHYFAHAAADPENAKAQLLGLLAPMKAMIVQEKER